MRQARYAIEPLRPRNGTTTAILTLILTLTLTLTLLDASLSSRRNRQRQYRYASRSRRHEPRTAALDTFKCTPTVPPHGNVRTCVSNQRTSEYFVARRRISPTLRSCSVAVAAPAGERTRVSMASCTSKARSTRTLSSWRA